MMHKFLILLVVAATIDADQPGCPCLPEGHASMSFHVNAATTDGKTDMLKVLAGGNNYYYPKNYGQGECAAWDTDLKPSCHIDPPRDWCKDKWCYVDKDNCDQTNEKSGYLVGDTDIYYSYETCGVVESGGYTAERQIVDPQDDVDLLYPGIDMDYIMA